MTAPYAKTPLGLHDQVRLLQSRGMTIANAANAEFYLSELNYYRLSGYWRLFESPGSSHRFLPGTSFEQVLNLYVFDRELRLLVLDAIERLEVSIRSHWAHQMAMIHGQHAHMNPLLHKDWAEWISDSTKMLAEVRRSKEAFIKHHRDAYSEALPPSWVVCEVMSLGLLSRVYANLKPMPTRRAVAQAYELDEGVLESWLHHFCVIRNLCAHHGRLWNRDFTVLPQLPRSKPASLAPQFQPNSRKIFNSLVMMLHLLDRISPAHHWRQRLKDLIAKHAVNPVAHMGFPSNWQTLPIWK